MAIEHQVDLAGDEENPDHGSDAEELPDNCRGVAQRVRVAVHGRRVLEGVHEVSDCHKPVADGDL